VNVGNLFICVANILKDMKCGGWGEIKKIHTVRCFTFYFIYQVFQGAGIFFMW